MSSILNEQSKNAGSLSSNNVSILINRESFEDASVGKSVLMLAVAHKLIALKSIHKAVWLDHAGPHTMTVDGVAKTITYTWGGA